MTFEAFDVVSVPFPFVDSSQSKRRPALVLSSATAFNAPTGHCVMAMITSAKNQPWSLDVPIKDLNAAGLPVASVVRMKVFTLDNRFVVGKIGALADKDRDRVKVSIQALVADFF